MKRQVALLLPLVLAACQDNFVTPNDNLAPGGSAEAVAMAQVPEQIMPGEVVARIRDGGDADLVARTHGLQVAEQGYRNSFVVLRGAVGNERALAARLRQDARIEYAEPNYLRQTQAIDSRLWAFFNDGSGRVSFTRGKNRGQVVASLLPRVDADEDVYAASAPSWGAGGESVLIGSIDTGVDLDHPEFLSGQLIAGQDWYNRDADPSDDDGHGTHTTGTMVGRTVGVGGVSGAGSNVRVFVQKVCGRRGCPVSAIASAIRAAADQPGMVAVNISIGGTTESQGEKDAIAYANSKGVLVIVSAGNGSSTTISCPACDPLAISVAATDWADGLAYYTNTGTGLDISAPGGELYSNTTEQAGIFSAYLDGEYAYLQGTSMAAPQVTGTAGVVASVTGLRGAALRSRIESTTDDIGAAGYDTSFGNGRLNSFRAATLGTID